MRECKRVKATVREKRALSMSRYAFPQRAPKELARPDINDLPDGQRPAVLFTLRIKCDARVVKSQRTKGALVSNRLLCSRAVPKNSIEYFEFL